MAKAILNGQTIFGNVALGQGGSNMHDYSTDEQIVGTWIDGKPVYEKTYKTTFTNIPQETPQNIADLSSLNIEEIISIEGSCSYSAPPQAPLYVNLGSFFYFYAYPNGFLQFIQKFTASTSNRTYIVIATIRYTKTA
jgi:hypothetical protein